MHWHMVAELIHPCNQTVKNDIYVLFVLAVNQLKDRSLTVWEEERLKINRSAQLAIRKRNYKRKHHAGAALLGYTRKLSDVHRATVSVVSNAWIRNKVHDGDCIFRPCLRRSSRKPCHAGVRNKKPSVTGLDVEEKRALCRTPMNNSLHVAGAILRVTKIPRSFRGISTTRGLESNVPSNIPTMSSLELDHWRNASPANM